MEKENTAFKIQLIEKRDARTGRGVLSKGWYLVDGKLVMVKGNSITENGAAGWEPYSEVMASKIAEILEIEHVEYKLMPAKLFPEVQTYSCDVVSVCQNFLKEGERLYHFADMVDAEFLSAGKRKSPDELYSYAIRLFGKEWLYRMLAFDALIGNEDRHENNFDVIVTEKGVRNPPLYDNGASLLAWVSDDELYENRLRYQCDRAKPFRTKHAQQIKLVDAAVIKKQDLNGLYEKILQKIEPELEMLPEKRANAIRFYLKERLHYLEAAMG